MGRLWAEIETAMIWLISVKFQAESKNLACAKDLTILSMEGRFQQQVQYRRESAHKSRALGNHSLLGVYIYAIQHISKEENKTVSGAWEKSAVAVRQFFSRSAYFSCCANISGRLIFSVCQHFCRRQCFSMHQGFSIRQRFWMHQGFGIRQCFCIHQCFWMRQCFCKYFATLIFLCIFCILI